MTSRYLNSLAESLADGAVAAVNEDTATAPDVSPIPASGALLTVAAEDVEIGDLLIDRLYARVAAIELYDLRWFYYDADGVVLHYVPHGDTVQVVRQEATP